MAKKQRKQTGPPPKPLTALITLVYSLITVGIVFIVILSKASLLDGDSWFRWPSIWLLIIYGVYYWLPIILSLLYGAVMRPFWMRFRDLIVAILFVQLVYSVGIHLWRAIYLQRRDELVYQTKRAEPFVYEAKHRFVDQDNDGVIEQVKCRVKIDMDEYPDGEYAIHAHLSQEDRQLSKRIIGEKSAVCWLVKGVIRH